MLTPIQLSHLEHLGQAAVIESHLAIRVPPSWASAGEDRVGYTIQTQLVECVRELHWRRDVLPTLAGATGDSVTRRLALDFLAPLLVGQRILGSYAVSWVRLRSYGLSVRLSAPGEEEPRTRAELTNVWYDPVERRAIPFPESVRSRLVSLAHR